MSRRRTFSRIFQSISRFFYSAFNYHLIMCFIVMSATIAFYLHKFPPKSTKMSKNLDDNSVTNANPKLFFRRQREMPPIIQTTTTTTTTTTTLTLDPELVNQYASYIDFEFLGSNIENLEQNHQPANESEIEYPSSSSHPLSNIVQLKGDPSLVIFNRLPHCYEHTFQQLTADVSVLNSIKYLPSQIYTPFFYDQTSLLTIARSLLNRTVGPLLYERHIYFFNFYDLKISSHPVWINIIQDPIRRTAIEYERTRRFCSTTTRCYVSEALRNLTLDQCVLMRSPAECISAQSGISRTLPFFCGSKSPEKCKAENDWALNEAKWNIQFYYSVIGIAEDFYKFLYVLEKIVPKFFKLSRLIYMNQMGAHMLADPRDLQFAPLSPKTVEILRPLLHFEYQLYGYVRDRFYQQYNVLVEMDS